VNLTLNVCIQWALSRSQMQKVKTFFFNEIIFFPEIATAGAVMFSNRMVAGTKFDFS